MASLESNIQLEATEQRGLFEFIQSLPDKSPTTFRIFDRGEYYTTHLDDAFFAAKEVFKSAGVIKKLGPKNVASVALSPKNFQFLLRELLIIKHYRVEVYGCKPGKLREDWELLLSGSPGNLTKFEDILYADHEMTETRGAGAVAIKTTVDGGRRSVGVAFCDTTNRVIRVSEFSDSEVYTNLETLLVQLSPKEAIVAGGGEGGNAFTQILQRMGLLVTERKKSEFATKDLSQDLSRILKKKKGKELNVTTLPEWDLTQAMCCLAALLKYLEILSSESHFNVYSMERFELANFMRIGASAVEALNLLPMAGESSTKSTSLFGLLNKCCTAPGQRLLGQWVKQPLIDVKKIHERLDVVETFMDSALRQTLADDHLKRFPDLQRLAKKLQRGKGTLQDIYAVFLSVKRVPGLIDALLAVPEDHIVLFNEMFIDPLRQCLGQFQKYMEMVESTIDASKPHELCIMASFAEKLQVLRDEMDDLESQISKILDRAARDLDLEAGKTIKLESTPQLGFFLRVTQKEEKKLRNNNSYMRTETNKSGVKFENQKMRDLNQEYLKLRNEYSEEEEGIKAQLVDLAAGYTQPMQLLNDLVAQLDVLISFATVSSNAPSPYIRPKVLPKGSGRVHLPQARHPCLEVQDDVAFIANDVDFDKDDGHSFHIITGPNMGGKSTYIRSIGMLCIMAQMGCFVPCAEDDENPATVTVVDAVLTRVGAGDSQLKGVSTFMAEMLESASILASASKDSLIIIDELGRGTSTYDGFGLAWAISEHIAAEIGSFCLFATHFHELTALAEALPQVNNLHVTALVQSASSTTEDAFTLLYTVRPGVCDQSFGIHVARLAHFPESVVEDAKRKAKELEDWQGMGAACSTTTHDDPETKRQKTDQEEGERIIDDFLKEWKGLPLEDMGQAEVDERLEAMRAKVMEMDNAFLKQFIKDGVD